MSLLLHELIHLSLGLLVGFFVWKKFKKRTSSLSTFLIAILAALVGSVFVDLDHLVDYFLAYGFQLNLKYFLEGYQFLQSDKIYVPLHSWELVIVLFAIYFFIEKRFQRPKKYILSFLLAFTLGLYSHLIFDTFTNQMGIPTYSFIYRMFNNFELNRMLTGNHYQRYLLEKIEFSKKNGL